MSNRQRVFTRHHVRKNGKILFMEAPWFVECVIRNVSEDGALLSMLVSVALPPKILLWEKKTGRIYECAVKWREEHMVGVRFTDLCGRAMRRALLEKCFAALTCEVPPTTH